MKLKKLKIVVFLLLSFILVFTACSAKDKDVVATVDGEKVSVSEFDFYLKTVKTEMETKAVQENVENFWETEIDGEKATKVAKDKALEATILNVVQLKKAADMGLELSEEDKAEVANRKNEYITSIGGRENYDKNLEEMGLNDKILTNLLEDDIIIQKLYGKIVAEDENVMVSDEDVKKYYDDNYEQFETGDQVRAKHILFKTIDENNVALPEEDVIKIKKKAEGILARLKDGDDFDQLMNQYSEDPGLAQYPEGYTFGQDGSMVKEFEDVAFSLKVGEISELVKSDFGYHILKVEDKFDHVPFDGVKDYVKSMLISEKYLDVVKSWKDDAIIETNDSVLEKIKVITD